MLISDKVDLSAKTVARDREGDYIMTKMSTCQEDIVVLKSMCTKQQNCKTCKAKAGELKGEIGDVKQSIQELVAAITAKSIDPQSGSNSNSQKFVPDAKGKSKSNGYSQNTNGTNAGSEGNN